MHSLRWPRTASRHRAARADRNVAIQLRVVGAVDLAHPAFAQLGDDFVRAEARANRQRHASEMFVETAILPSALMPRACLM